MNDIIYFNANSRGNDYLIGDVHGNRNCLEKVIARLTQEDRLFIVGDLTDRGHDSPGVIDLIQQYKGQIFVVKGNHEKQCLKLIKNLESLVFKKSYLFESARFRGFLNDTYHGKISSMFADFNQSEKDRCSKEYKKIEFSLKNDRQWLMKLYHQEQQQKYITVHNDRIKYTSQSKIGQIKDYMNNLPYIIHVLGENPFNVVHADMPFDNSVLMQRIENSGFALTRSEKEHAVWARGNDKKPFLEKISFGNIITYVGHNIIKDNVPIVRYESNTINLDVATYKIDSSLMVNHTHKRSQFVGEQPSKDLASKKEELDNYLVFTNNPETFTQPNLPESDYVESDYVEIEEKPYHQHRHLFHGPQKRKKEDVEKEEALSKRAHVMA